MLAKIDNEAHQTLGDNTVPSRYILNLRPDMSSFRYDGTETIKASVKKKTNTITMNSVGLRIKSSDIISKGIAQKASAKTDDKRQALVLRFKKPVSGSIDIRIEFSGIVKDDIYGFYRSKYVHDGKTRYILSSQFEAANARNAFPCFDEPAFKAIFELSFTVANDLDCISNMPVKVVRKADAKRKLVKFDETPVMSTYLLYLGVGNYDYVSGSAGKTKVRVVTTPGRKAMAKVPLDYAIKFIRFYEKYFGIRYPLPKADFLAIPDFAAGAMENWGAITFREVALLADEKTSLAGKQRVAEVIAHELAHQWFGDLVTMNWWNDLWLNESFATFMASKAMDDVFPEWKVKIEYLRDTIATAFGADQLKSTHPISVSVNSPAEIDQLFDEISYDKGGTVLNMLEHYAGAETFRQGLHTYLKEHSYSNATKYDLWKAIDKAASKDGKRLDVRGVAGFWIDKPGYPMVDVQRANGSARLEQSRYFLLKDLSDKTVWPIPLNYSISGRSESVLFGRKIASIKAGDKDWLKLNYGQNGLYRVRYGMEDIKVLGQLIKSRELGPADGWGIENDLFSLSRSGRAKVSEYLEFVERYCFGAEYPIDANVLGHLGGLHNMLYYYDSSHVKQLSLRYSNSILGKLGWEVRKGESPHDTLMRPSAIMRSAMSGSKETVGRAVEMFHSYMKGKSDIDTNIRGAIYTIAAWVEGGSIADTLKERYEREKVPEEKVRFLRALAMFNDKDLLLDSLDFSMSKQIRLQDSYIIPAICSSNPVGKTIMLDWTEDNWVKLTKMHASGTHMIGRYIDNLDGLDTKKDKEEVESFFRSKKNWRDDIRHSFDNTIELIEANIRFVEANK